MDKLEELFCIALSRNCFKDAYQKRVFDSLADLDHPQSETIIDVDSKNSLLLKLTVVQKLFQRLKTVRCPYLRSIAYALVKEKLLVGKLLKCLNHKNQHVVFSASKAIVKILQMLSKSMIKAQWIDSLIYFIRFGQESEHPWRKLYSMELLRKVLKHSRSTENQKNKDENINCQQVESQACCCAHDEDKVHSFSPGSELVELFSRHLNLQHILFEYIPFVVRPNGVYSFMKSCHHVGTVENFVMLQACLKFGKTVHDQEQVKRDPTSGIKECNLIAFLNFVVEIAKCLHNKGLLSSLNSESTENHESMASESEDDPRGRTQPEAKSHLQIIATIKKQLETVVATLTQYLHYPRLPSLIFKKILEVLNQVVMIPSSTLFGWKRDCTNSSKIMRSTLISFLSVVECCLLDKVPKYLGKIGFCGTEVKSSGSSFALDSQREFVDVVALRKAGLILVKSAFVVLKMTQNQEGSSVFQKLSLSCVALWCTHLLNVAPDMLFLNDTKQNCNPNEFHSLLVSLFVDQDDELVEILLLLLLLYQEIQRLFGPNVSEEKFFMTFLTVVYLAFIAIVRNSEFSASVLRQLNPHRLFVAFMESVDFDQSVLLDLLISSETRFLEYVLQYLHFIMSDWKSFIQSLESYKGKVVYNEIQAAGEELTSVDRNELESVLDLSNVQLLEGSRRVYGKLNPSENQSPCRKQNKEAAEDEVILKNKAFSVCERSSLDTDNSGSFISCQKTGSRCDKSRGHVSDAARNSEICNQPVCGIQNKKNRNSVGKTVGLKSIALAYTSSDESDMEVEDNGVDAGAFIQVNTFNKSTSVSCLHFQTTTFLPQDGNLNVATCDSHPECGKKTSTVFVSATLDKIMTMLIRLRISVTRLSLAGHFPYSASPLLALMKNVEKSYDGC